MLKVCIATSECVPYIKTGGLADVCGSLPKTLAVLGCEVKLFLPRYGTIDCEEHGLVLAADLQEISVEIAGRMVSFTTWYGRLPGSAVEVYLIDCPAYFERPGPYTSDPDEDERFILFQHAIINVLQRYHWAPDILHCNDWQTSLLPVFLRTTYGWDGLFARTATVLAIHNIAYQGSFPLATIAKAGLSYELAYPGGPFEFYGSFSFLKSGLVFADVLSTVSKTYAKEIQTPQFGEGLDGVLRSRAADLFGILNGIDTEVWNPSTDPHITRKYNAETLDRKVENKRFLLEQANMPFDRHVPVVGIMSRLIDQKGIELVQPILEYLIRKYGVQFVVHGQGDHRYEEFFRWAAATFPGHVAATLGYTEPEAHRVAAGCDMLLMPSRFEPCGLTQMYSMAYGTVPVVRKTGGLADTVRDYHEYDGTGDGFSFTDYSPFALYTTVVRALELGRERENWNVVMRRGMLADNSWMAAATNYLDLYRLAMRRRGVEPMPVDEPMLPRADRGAEPDRRPEAPDRDAEPDRRPEVPGLSRDAEIVQEPLVPRGAVLEAAEENVAPRSIRTTGRRSVIRPSVSHPTAAA
jgi:starch synthase